MGKTHTKMSFSRLRRCASRGRYALYGLLQLLFRGLSLLIPYLTELLIDAVSGGQMNRLLRYSAELLLVNIFFVIVLSLAYYVRVCYEDAAIALEKQEMLSGMFQMPLSSLQEKGSGYFVQRISSTIESCRSFLIEKPVNFYINILYAAGILVSMFRIHCLYALLLLAIFPLISYFYVYLARKAQAITGESEALNDQVNSLVEEAYSCNYTLRTSGAEEWMQGRSKSLLLQTFLKNREYAQVETVYDFFLITGLMNLMTVMVYILGGFLAFRGAVTFGMVVSMSLLYSKLWSPLEFYLDYPKERAKYLARRSRLEELRGAIPPSVPPSARLPIFQRMELREVTCTVGGRTLLKDLSFSFHAGEHIAICGGNGSGKTTLANILAAIDPDYSGSVLYNSIPYRDVSAQDVRSHVCLIPSRAELFAGTIRDNLLLGQTREIPSLVVQLLEKKGLPLDLEVQENGTNLSGGERKLVQLARGFCRSCDVYIIDEPLNYIDDDFAEMVVQALDALFDKRTVLIISHDQRAFRSCGKRYVLDKQTLTPVPEQGIST